MDFEPTTFSKLTTLGASDAKLTDFVDLADLTDGTGEHSCKIVNVTLNVCCC